MDKRTCIIKVFQNCPETWTDAQINDIAQTFNIELSRHELRNAKRRDESIIYNALQDAINECIASASGLEFDARKDLLLYEILPAVDLLEKIDAYYYSYQ